MQIVRHGYGARDFARRHVIADVDVAQLRDAQTIELWRQIRHRHIDALNRVAQASGSKTISRGEKRKAPSDDSGVLKKSSPRVTKAAGDRSGTQARRDVREPFDCSH